MEYIIAIYKKWKQEHPDEDYQYDSIFEFVNAKLGGGDLLSLLNFAESRYDKEQRNEQN